MSVLVQEAEARPKRTYKRGPERREQILDCALEVFAEQGYHQSSIADVCGRAGIGRGTLYQYFEDKRGLLVALAERIAAKVTRHVETRPKVDLTGSPRPSAEAAVAFIEGRFVSALRVVFEDAATARIVLRAGRSADGVVQEILRRVDDAILSMLEAELRLAMKAGVVRPLDEKLVARFFLGGVEKLVLGYLDEDRPIDLQKIAHEAAMLEAHGILATPDSGD